LVSLLGVTGAREELRKSTMDLIKRAKDYTKGMIPLGVGFGISKPEHVRSAISAGADGAIVGSGIVNQIADNLSDEDMMLKRIESYVASLKEATRV
jgi:tryptophan synthase alpha chain